MFGLFLRCGFAQFTLTTAVNPVGAGTISPGGSYPAGTRLQLTATPAPGYYFQQFTGGLTGAPNPQILFVNADTTVTANFVPVAPVPYVVASTGKRTLGPSSGQLTVNMRLTNTVGCATATAAQIESIGPITTITGTGDVSVARGLPAAVGDLASAATGAADVVFNWPSTVTQVQMTVNFSATGGAYTGSTVLNVLYNTQIQHIVFLIQENRSFDNYFGKFPGAEGATSGMTSTGAVVPLKPDPDNEASDLCHHYYCELNAIDNGKMDMFDVMDPNSPPNLRSYVQFGQAGIPNYWKYASTYTLADHMFSSLWGPSFPNHLYTIAAQSGGAIDNSGSNGVGFDLGFAGCDAPSNYNVLVWSPYLKTYTYVYPCFDFPTLGDTIDNANVSNPSLTWRYYSPAQGQKGYEWNAYAAINHIRYGPDWNSNIVPESQFITDAQNGNLPSVSWVVPPAPVSEHPSYNVCAGENDTVSRINAVMTGPQWDSTAIFLFWDDSGGFYDHVYPPQQSYYGYGIRVPLMVLSPYAKPGYISKTVYSFDSLLSFAENVMGLPPMLMGDTMANNLSDCFDFTQTPLPPLVLNQRTCPTIKVACVLEAGEVGKPYLAALKASNGKPPYHFLFTSETGLPGLALDPATGAIKGTPSTPGTFDYIPEVYDSTGAAATKNCKLVVSPAPLVPACPANSGTVGTAYSSSANATGGVPPYKFVTRARSLPPGLTFSSSGAITGTPTTAGSFGFELHVADSGGQGVTKGCAIAIAQ